MFPFKNIFATIALLTKSNQTFLKVKRIRNLDGIYEKYSAKSLGLSESTTLDLGCGANPRNPFQANIKWGIDIREDLDHKIKSVDLTIHSIPFEDRTFDYITAFDFIEHVPRIIYAPDCRFPFIQLMNEIWRTLKEGGIFFSFTPVYPFKAAFNDPTHVNYITEETFDYFNDGIRLGSMYGFTGKFTVLEQYRTHTHLISILKKVKV
ncbi:class I SAM-dependent methyltransferase [Polynucleobacter sp. Nonnen-W13]|uniref:methyltransferase domain-containing protein n=1 Tax=Polynucleobacter sp. Nonnen-W13 TaxID=1855625 RepID=UPI001C0D5795|nr:class I SAM-dependent methyltransferase [Polynucleobacter sp. Nonnen-W13]MBU3558295.1 class I SAM-dependent methyltransferase [Polynucleobacter sp. Nonnen-W13]